MAHSRNSPSFAATWMGCVGALNRIKALGITDDRSSAFAAEGTAAHWVRENCLEFGFEPHDFIGTKIEADGFTFVCTEDMADHLLPGIDRVREFEGRLFTEVWVDTTEWVGLDDEGNRQGGTVDAGIVGPDEIVISDLKFGMGVPVQAVNNKQLRIYALGFWNQVARHLTNARRFRIIIDQPRNSGGGGEWVITLDDLLAFGEEVKAKAEAGRDPDAPCTPSEDACRWCPLAKMDNACPEHEEWKLDFLGITFEDLDDDLGTGISLPPFEGITPARRRVINQHSHIIKKWLDRLHADELTDVLQDGPAHGVKAVAGRKPGRKHVDEEQSEAFLRKKFRLSDDKLFTKKLISVAQLDTLLGKGVFPKSLVDQGDPKPVLVPVEDDRPALLRATEFEDLDADDASYD
jgi:hypothetical protein